MVDNTTLDISLPCQLVYGIAEVYMVYLELIKEDA